MIQTPNPFLMSLMTSLVRRTTLTLLFGCLVIPTALASMSSWPASSTATVFNTLSTYTPAFEPSGLTTDDGVIYLVDDEGRLVSLDGSGNILENWNLASMVGHGVDAEAITFSSDGRFFLADENGAIREFNLESSTYVQKWDISAWIPEAGGTLGMESLTYVDGYFYAGNQANGGIYVFDLSSATPSLVTQYASAEGYTDLAELTYYNGYVYALYDANNVLEVLTTDGELVSSFTNVPGTEQEGILFFESTSSTTQALIAEDTPTGLKLYDGFPVLAPESEEAPLPPESSTITDADSDGVPAESDCDDNNALVSTPQSFYVDSDQDGLGSTTVESICASEAPLGYSFNAKDTNDSIPNAGVEIKKNGLDDDGDGLVDETNNPAKGDILHPYYSLLDPSLSSSGMIKSFWGLKNGDFAVRFVDFSVYRYSVSTIKTDTVSTVYSVDSSGYFVVIAGTEMLLTNGYTGQVVASSNITTVPSQSDALSWAKSQLGW